MDNTPVVQTTNIPIEPIPPPSSRNYLKFIIAGLIILSIGLFGGYYLTKSSITEKPSTKQPEKIPQISTVLSFPTPDLYTESSRSATANWKTYNKNGLSFKYPPDWIGSNYVISTSSPMVKLNIVPKDSSLMNECMQETATENKVGFVIKRFSRVTTGAMCATSDSTPRQIWIMPSTSNYSPGIMYQYSSPESLQAETIFDQILSTFKFLDQKSENSVSQECGVCGPQGIHNVSGAVCAQGLVCKRGLTTSLSYCVGQNASTENCEKSQ